MFPSQQGILLALQIEGKDISLVLFQYQFSNQTFYQAQGFFITPADATDIAAASLSASASLSGLSFFIPLLVISKTIGSGALSLGSTDVFKKSELLKSFLTYSSFAS